MGEIQEREDDSSEWDKEEEPTMGAKEILASMTRLRRALLSRGEVCVRTAKLLVLAQDEIVCEEIRNARQTTLEQWFHPGHAPE